MRGEFLILNNGSYEERKVLDEKTLETEKIMGVGEESYFYIKRMTEDSLKKLEERMEGCKILYNLGSQVKTKTGKKVDVYRKVTYEWIVEDLDEGVKSFVNKYMGVKGTGNYVVKGVIQWQSKKETEQWVGKR